MRGGTNALGSVDRREFLRKSSATGGALMAATLTGSAAWSAEQAQPLRMAFVGLGGMGTGHYDFFRERDDVQVTALCDVDAGHLARAKEKTPSAASSGDFREIVTRDDVDAVLVATPDHWHALVTIAAAKAGKHVYCEKPLANSIGEGRSMADAVKQAGVVLQTGSHERSNRGAAVAKQIVDSGRLGKIHTVQIRLPNSDGHLQEVENFTSPPPNSDPPAGLDYDFWLGHTPVVPYNEKRCHFWWRFHSRYGGGEMTDRGAHVIDLAQYLLGLDDTGPIAIEAKGKRPAGNFFDAFITFQFENHYANGLRMVGDNSGPRGLTLVGSDGELTIAVHGCALSAKPASLLEGFDLNSVNPYTVHREGWLAAIRGGVPTVAPAEAGHRTATICHLNNLAMYTGKSFAWDPEKEQADEAEVNELLTPQMREPWSLA